MSESKMHLDMDEFLDEDKHTISVHNDDDKDAKYGGIALSSPLLRGMDLDLSFAAENKQRREDFNSEGIQEESVNVVFDLPDGSQGENTFKLGQTVEVLKSFIESEYGIMMAEQKLYLDDRIMHNPFSLLDYPEAKGAEEIFVRVEGTLPKNSKK